MSRSTPSQPRTSQALSIDAYIALSVPWPYWSSISQAFGSRSGRETHAAFDGNPHAIDLLD